MTADERHGPTAAQHATEIQLRGHLRGSTPAPSADVDDDVGDALVAAQVPATATADGPAPTSRRETRTPATSRSRSSTSQEVLRWILAAERMDTTRQVLAVRP